MIYRNIKTWKCIEGLNGTFSNWSLSSDIQNEICIWQESVNTKFLGLQIDNHINWTYYIDKLIPKLSAACYAVRFMLHVSNTDTLKSVYFAYFHSIMKYGIIFWGNSSNSKKIFALQKKIRRVMVGARPTNSCRSLFNRL
jgi:hypothetical protein